MKIRNIFGNTDKTIVGNVQYSIPTVNNEDKIDIKTIKSQVHEPIQLDEPTLTGMTLGYVPQYDFKKMSEAEDTSDDVSLVDTVPVRYLTLDEPKPTHEDVLNEYKDELKQKEGLRLKAYKDSGDVWTIGYGHTKGVKPGDSITLEEAERLLDEDIASHSEWLQRQIESYDLNPNEFIALFDFAYNTGVGNLQKLMRNADKNTIRSRLGMWGLRDAKGNVLQGLVDRANWRVKTFG